jgi:hypothetical protein
MKQKCTSTRRQFLVTVGTVGGMGALCFFAQGCGNVNDVVAPAQRGAPTSRALKDCIAVIPKLKVVDGINKSAEQGPSRIPVSSLFPPDMRVSYVCRVVDDAAGPHLQMVRVVVEKREGEYAEVIGVDSGDILLQEQKAALWKLRDVDRDGMQRIFLLPRTTVGGD